MSHIMESELFSKDQSHTELDDLVALYSTTLKQILRIKLNSECFNDSIKEAKSAKRQAK